MSPFRWIALSTVVLFTVGCAPTLPPRPAAAQVTPPDGWYTRAAGTPVAASAAVSAGWWHEAGDPVLDRLVQDALANNLDLQLAATRVQEARSQERAARAALFPSLDAGLGLSRGQSINAFGHPSLATAGQPQLQIGYEVDLFGRIASQNEAAHQGVLGATYAHEAARLMVSAATASSYFNLRALDQRLLLLRQTVVNREQSLKLADSRLQAGYTSALETGQARAELEGARQQIPVVELAIARQEHALALLTGTAPQALARGKPLDELTLPAVAPSLPSELLRRRPDIAQAESQLAATDAQLAVARAQFLPQLRLSASLANAYSTALPVDPIKVWSIGGSLLAPLLEGGRLEGNFGAATARRDQAAFAYRKTVLTAFKEVEDALAAIDFNARQQTAQTAQLRAVADTLQHADNRYRAGYSSHLEKIDAERSLLGVQLSQIQAHADQLSAQVALHQALGGGWQVP